MMLASSSTPTCLLLLLVILFDICLLRLQDRQQAMKLHFRGHVILCLLADQSSPQIGLVHFIMPLRSANIDLLELKVSRKTIL